ncbi:MAG: anti-sigma factor domain-containing protein [Solirubrobacterales bacterium]
MTAGDDHRRREDEVAAYALGALTASEAAEFEEHMLHCESCRAQLEWLQPATTALSASVPQLEPPGRLRRRILAEARAEASPRGPARSIADRWRGWLVPAAALGAVAIAVAIGVASLGGGGQSGRTVSAEVLSGRAPDASGKLVTVDGRATLEVEHMPRLPRADVYEAWIQAGDEIEPSTTFIVDRNGDGAAAIPDVGDADRVMVTREPRGGSEMPTSEPLLQATLSAS